jgi:hypothetical protein
MLRLKRRFDRLVLIDSNRLIGIIVAVISLILFSGISGAQQKGQKTFSTPEEASHALFVAVQKNDQQALLEILGSAGKEIISSGDAVEDKNNRDRFVKKYEQMHRLDMEPDGTTTLFVGAENWPLPIPIASKAGVWYYDTDSGKQEILFRRIGRNELSTIRVFHQLIDAQKEYYAQSHDGDPVKQYARKFASDQGKHNGLYWKASNGETESPIGPLVAYARGKGYTKSKNAGPRPFQGYYYRILTRQGKNAPGGEKSYVVNGKMTEGFAFLAYPAVYRVSGVMTFIVDQDGIVYQKDLGPKTASSAKEMNNYDPDATWEKAE